MLAVALTTLVTYFGERVPVRLAIQDGAGLPVPPERASRLADLAAQLEEHGFSPVGTAAPTDPDARTTAYARILRHTEEDIGAWAIDMAAGDQVATYVELVTEWEDGRAVSTLNHDRPPIFEPLPRLTMTALPGAPVATVVGAHRLECSTRLGPRVDVTTIDPIERAHEQNAEVLAYQAERGILRRRGEDYGFTFRGARQSVRRIARAMH